MSVLIFVRHGQASFGAERYDQLTPRGREQARLTGHRLGGLYREEGFLICCGPRQRHLETADELLDAAERVQDPVMLEALDEFAEGEEILDAASILFGRNMQGPAAPPLQEQLRCYAEAYAAWSRGTLGIPGRAPFRDFRQGVGEWLKERVADNQPGQHIVAVTSAGVIAAAVCETLGLPDSQWLNMIGLMRNAALTEIVFSRSKMSLRSFNCAGHLSPDVSSSI